MERLGRHFHGLELELARTSGARALRVIHPASQSIAEHQHDWACLTLYALGGYTERYEGGEARITGPSAVLHPPGSPHANSIAEDGLETVSIEFDPAWLRHAGAVVPERPRCWTGGAAVAAARSLALAWAAPGRSDADLARETAHFLRSALGQPTPPPDPAWLGVVREALDPAGAATTRGLARRLALHPAWIARAYRSATGEGLQATLRRRRVERAVRLLRRSDTPPAQIAVEAGFCDQSHMHRAFREMLGRTPRQVRAERERLGYA